MDSGWPASVAQRGERTRASMPKRQMSMKAGDVCVLHGPGCQFLTNACA